MASYLASKELPPPPLRIEKQRTMPNPHQQAALIQHATQATAGPSDSSASGPSHLGVPSQNGEASVTPSRTPSGRFRIRVPSLTKQARSSEAAQNGAAVHNTSHPASIAQVQDKVWQPRWAPKLKRTNPSKAVTTYSPILDPQLPAFAPFVASPPPAVQLDDAGFGRPFSTTGLFDLADARFSFLDMRMMDNDSDSDSSDSLVVPVRAPQPPVICEPPKRQNAQGDVSAETMAAAIAAPTEMATAPGSVRHASAREMLRVPPTSATPMAQDSQAARSSLVSASPALASLISSFPSPLTRDSNAAPSSSDLDPMQSVDSNAPKSRPAIPKENSWDGGERWELRAAEHNAVSSGHDSVETPYLDMDDDDDDEAELLEATLAQPPSVATRSALGLASVSPPKMRVVRNPPPRPAPSMALPDLPAPSSSAGHSNARQHTPTSSVQLDSQQRTDSQLGSASSSKQKTQRPLILPTLRSSSSVDRLSAMGSAHASPSAEHKLAKMANGHNLKPLTLPGDASTEELAKSLDVSRDTVKQMLDTTQHVWRNHLLGSSIFHGDAPSTTSGPERLPRSSSSPMLSTMFVNQGSSESFVTAEDSSKGSVAKSVAGRNSNRSSMLGLPYISSSRPSFEFQSPGWAVSKNGADAARTSTTDSQAERARKRRTFLGRSSDEGSSANYNFSRPIRRDANGIEAGMSASASMPSLAAAREAPKPPALLQSPLLLKGESEATGFAQFAVDDEQEVLVDSSSESYQPFAPSRMMPTPIVGPSTDADEPAIDLAGANLHKAMPELPAQGKTASPRPRRNSDTVLNAFAPEFGKRAPGELHAWSVCIDQDGVPAIRPSASAFHRPDCSLAGKSNATWQCGCRTSISGDFNAAMSPRTNGISAQNLVPVGQSSPGRSRSLSAGNVMDPVRQAQLWSQVEQNKDLIRKHEEKIAGLQEQVKRMSTEIASARPSFSSTFPTPELLSTPNFPAPPNRTHTIARKPLPTIVSPESETPPVPAKSPVIAPLPSMAAAPTAAASRSTSTLPDPPRTLRGRIASLSKMNVAWKDENVAPAQTAELGHPSRLRASSSTSSLNKVFRFPWSRSSDKVNAAFPQPTPFPLGERNHTKAASVSASFSRNKSRPSVRMLSVDEQRPLPAPPLSEASMLGKDKRYPPSSRKFSYEMLHGPAFETSVGSRHLRGRSGSSKSSSFGTSIFSSNEGPEMQESSRFATFAKLGRRWDSISSRGTNTSARNSSEVSSQPTSASLGSMQALSTLSASESAPLAGAKPMASLARDLDKGLRRSKTPPPRRSSLLRRSLENAPTKRAPIPSEFLQAKDPVMAPISEQSEMGSPASTRAARNAEMEMSPASVIASPQVGEGRMSMSERYRLQGLTVPAPLALSSSLTSPMLGSVTEPISAGKASVSPRSGKSPLPVAFSHGTLTVARRPSLAS